MDTLANCKNIINEYENSNSDSNSSQRPVNVGMSPELVSRIDNFVDSDFVEYDNRSELIRSILTDKIEEWEAEFEIGRSNTQ